MIGRFPFNFAAHCRFATDLLKMKKTIFTLILLLSLLTGACFAQVSMYVHETNSAQTAYPLDSIRKLTFPAGTLLVHKTAGDTASYSFATIRMVNFSGIALAAPAVPAASGQSISAYAANEMLQLNYISGSASCVIEIIDLTGRIVYSENRNQQPGVQTSTTISLNGFAPGVYVCCLNAADGTAVRKILVQ